MQLNAFGELITTFATICLPTRQPMNRESEVDRSRSHSRHFENRDFRSTSMRTASWLGFVVGLCCGMSITAVLAISILCNVLLPA
ncbi:UNVERIFIED_ORG: hypothetical protein BCL66_10463 [Martelella mediterranea]